MSDSCKTPSHEPPPGACTPRDLAVGVPKLNSRRRTPVYNRPFSASRRARGRRMFAPSTRGWRFAVGREFAKRMAATAARGRRLPSLFLEYCRMGARRPVHHVPGRDGLARAGAGWSGRRRSRRRARSRREPPAPLQVLVFRGSSSSICVTQGPASLRPCETAPLAGASHPDPRFRRPPDSWCQDDAHSRPPLQDLDGPLLETGPPAIAAGRRRRRMMRSWRDFVGGDDSSLVARARCTFAVGL